MTSPGPLAISNGRLPLQLNSRAAELKAQLMAARGKARQLRLSTGASLAATQLKGQTSLPSPTSPTPPSTSATQPALTVSTTAATRASTVPPNWDMNASTADKQKMAKPLTDSHGDDMAQSIPIQADGDKPDENVEAVSAPIDVDSILQDIIQFRQPSDNDKAKKTLPTLPNTPQPKTANGIASSLPSAKKQPRASPSPDRTATTKPAAATESVHKKKKADIPHESGSLVSRSTVDDAPTTKPSSSKEDIAPYKNKYSRSSSTSKATKPQGPGVYVPPYAKGPRTALRTHLQDQHGRHVGKAYAPPWAPYGFSRATDDRDHDGDYRARRHSGVPQGDQGPSAFDNLRDPDDDLKRYMAASRNKELEDFLRYSDYFDREKRAASLQRSRRLEKIEREREELLAIDEQERKARAVRPRDISRDVIERSSAQYAPSFRGGVLAREESYSGYNSTRDAVTPCAGEEYERDSVYSPSNARKELFPNNMANRKRQFSSEQYDDDFPRKIPRTSPGFDRSGYGEDSGRSSRLSSIEPGEITSDHVDGEYCPFPCRERVTVHLCIVEASDSAQRETDFCREQFAATALRQPAFLLGLPNVSTIPIPTGEADITPTRVRTMPTSSHLLPSAMVAVGLVAITVPRQGTRMTESTSTFLARVSTAASGS